MKSNPIFKATAQVGMPTPASRLGAQAMWLPGLKSFELLKRREEVPPEHCSPRCSLGTSQPSSDTKDHAFFQQGREKVLNIA